MNCQVHPTHHTQNYFLFFEQKCYLDTYMILYHLKEINDMVKREIEINKSVECVFKYDSCFPN